MVHKRTIHPQLVRKRSIMAGPLQVFPPPFSVYVQKVNVFYGEITGSRLNANAMNCLFFRDFLKKKGCLVDSLSGFVIRA